MNKIARFSLMLMLLTGCMSRENVDTFEESLQTLDNLSVYPEDQKPLYSIKLEKEVSFSDTQDVFTGSADIIAIDALRRVYIAAGSQFTIHVFQPDGSYYTSIGREGEGPGAFHRFSSLAIHSDQLFVYDSSQQRINVYSLNSLRHSYTLNIEPMNQNEVEELTGYRLNRLYVRNDDTLFAGFSPIVFRDPSHPRYNLNELYTRYYLLDTNGNIISDQLIQQEMLKSLTAYVGGEFRATAFEFLGKSLLAVSENGYFFTANSKNFLIKVYDPEGNYLRAFYYPISKKEFTREDALRSVRLESHESVVEWHESVILNAREELPETWPVLDEILVDDENRLWISTIVEDQEVYEWWVLRDTGELITTFTWPRDRRIVKVKNSYLYIRETDEMDVASIVRYRIEMEER